MIELWEYSLIKSYCKLLKVHGMREFFGLGWRTYYDFMGAYGVACLVKENAFYLNCKLGKMYFT